MKIELLTETDEGSLEEFVAEHPHGSIEQTWAWGELLTTVSGRPKFYVFGVFQGFKMAGSMLVVRQNMGFGKSWLWCPRGPLLPERKSDEAWDLMRAECEKIAKINGDLYLRVEPGVPANDDWPVRGKAVKESYLPQHTLVVDLTVGEKEILKQMAQKGRYNIKKADKAGVYVLRAGLDDLEDYYEIFKVTAARDGFQIHKKEFYRELFDKLEGKLFFYAAFIDRELIAGIFVTHFGKTATYYYGASSNKHRQAMAPYSLQWFAMVEAKKAGMEKYDFFGIAPEGDSRHAFAGVTQFKTRFGGERVEYHKAQLFVYRPVWAWVVRVVKKVF